jgi:hypothetical protein
LLARSGSPLREGGLWLLSPATTWKLFRSRNSAVAAKGGSIAKSAGNMANWRMATGLLENIQANTMLLCHAGADIDANL